jgi:long-chain acyl-CoA synthetase
MPARSKASRPVRDDLGIDAAVRGVTRLSRSVDIVVAEFQLSVSQFRVLDRLVDGVVGGRSLADWLSVKPPSVTALVDGLVERGLVLRGVDPADRRMVTHALTPAGARLHTVVCERIAARLRDVLGHVDDPDQSRALIEALAGWNRAFDLYREAMRARRSGGGAA